MTAVRCSLERASTILRPVVTSGIQFFDTTPGPPGGIGRSWTFARLLACTGELDAPALVAIERTVFGTVTMPAVEFGAVAGSDRSVARRTALMFGCTAKPGGRVPDTGVYTN